jgi:hypothetical protein
MASFNEQLVQIVEDYRAAGFRRQGACDARCRPNRPHGVSHEEG